MRRLRRQLRAHWLTAALALLVVGPAFAGNAAEIAAGEGGVGDWVVVAIAGPGLLLMALVVYVVDPSVLPARSLRQAGLADRRLPCGRCGRGEALALTLRGPRCGWCARRGR